MSKNFKRTLALVLAVLMMAGLFAIVPTVSAEVTADDILFEMDFTEFEGGAAVVKKGDGTTAVTTENTFEAVEGRNGKKALSLTGGGSTSANFPCWKATDYNPFAEELTEGVTLNTVVNFNNWDQNTYLFFFNPINSDENGWRHIMYVKLETGRKVTVYIRNAQDNKQHSFSCNLNSTAAWMMFTYVEDPTDNTMSFYVNGMNVLHTTAAITDVHNLPELGKLTPNDSAYYSVGGSKGGPWNDKAVNGRLESFTAYNRALSAEEIKKVYDDKDFTSIVENFTAYDTRKNTNSQSAAGQTPNGESWMAVPNAQAGSRVYYDRNTATIESLPEFVVGGDMIVTAMSSKTPTDFDSANPFATFTVNKRANVYVVIDARIGDNEMPITKLVADGYTPVEGELKIKDNSAKFNKIYTKVFEKDATVSLPAQLDNDSCTYLAFVTEAQEEVIPVDHEFSVTNSDAVVTQNGEKFDITWNATVALDEGVELAALNDKVDFTEYGVIYGTSAEEVAKAAAGEATDNAKIKAFDKIEGEETDVDVYTIFGFRLKGVAAERARAAQFYVTYTLDGEIYTVYSECETATAAIVE